VRVHVSCIGKPLLVYWLLLVRKLKVVVLQDMNKKKNVLLDFTELHTQRNGNQLRHGKAFVRC